MPNRIIKESILTSSTMASLSAEAERHFYRLLLLADDYGCLESTDRVVWGKCYAVHEGVDPSDVRRWTDELETAGVISQWRDDGRVFARFRTFDKHNSAYCVTDNGKRTRHRRKTPRPPDDLFVEVGPKHPPQDNGRKDNKMSQGEPSGASRSQHGPNPNPNPEIYNNPGKYSVPSMADRTPEPGRKNKRHQKNPPGLAHRLKDYQVEVVNKCEGRIGHDDHPSAGLFYRIGEEVPSEIVKQALAQMQDKRQDRLADDDRPKVRNLRAYYIATVREMCRERGVETSINWKGGEMSGKAETSRPDRGLENLADVVDIDRDPKPP